MSDEHIKLRIQELRISQPGTCWRPNSAWQNVCIQDFGHDGPCGWDHPAQRGHDCISCGATVEYCDQHIKEHMRGCCTSCYRTDTHGLSEIGAL